MSTRQVFMILKKYFLIILGSIFVMTSVTGIFSYFVLKPVYSASTQIIVNPSVKEGTTNITYDAIQANLQLINTYNVIIKSPTILDNVRKQLNLSESTSGLNDQITVSNEKNSQVITVTVENTNPNKARTIANTVATVFQQQIGKIMNANSVNVLAQADVVTSPQPVKPKPVLNMIIAAIVGLIIGISTAFILFYLNDSQKKEEESK